MTINSNFWVIGGEFGSMNFHKLVEGSAQVQGPFKTRTEAEDAWREAVKVDPDEREAAYRLIERRRSTAPPDTATGNAA